MIRDPFLIVGPPSGRCPCGAVGRVFAGLVFAIGWTTSVAYYCGRFLGPISVAPTATSPTFLLLEVWGDPCSVEKVKDGAGAEEHKDVKEDPVRSCVSCRP